MDIELDNKEFQNVWRLIADTNSSVFMTGRAGTGKSTFLRYIVEHIKKKTVVLAPTGIAAVNAGGVTLHSFFKIPLQPFALDDINYSDVRRVREMQKFTSEKIKLLQEVELIVIDEVSMVRADVLDFVDRVLRTYARRYEPFGGKQMLLVGDAFQLEPVVKGQDWDILRRFYTTPYFFGAQVFQNIRLVQVELRKVYRQKEADFLALLDKVRIGMSTPADIAMVNQRVSQTFEPEAGQMYITLTSTRATSDLINERHLNELDTEEVTFEGVISGDFPESSLPTNKLLTLKEGSQVVFVRNDKEKRWFNGTVGRVTSFTPDGAWVEVDRPEASDDDSDGQSPATDKFFVETEIWENIKYRYDEKEHKVVSELLGTYEQIPLKLAWAITIHKSQGLTFDRVIIDLGRGAFACGQVYVALSRCRSLSGIVLRQQITMNDIKTNMSVRDFSYGANDEALINHQLDEARAQSIAVEARDAFRHKDYSRAVNLLMDSLAIDPGKMRDAVVRRYISTKVGAAIGKLESEVGRLMESEKRLREKSFQFAYEYYLLAVDCIRNYDDSRAARANINKAIAMSPDYTDALLLRAELGLEEGDFRQVVDDVTLAARPGAIKKKAKLAKAMTLRAQAYIGMRHWERAFADLNLVISSGDATPDRLRMMVNVCRHLDRGDEAEMYGKIAERLEQNDNEDFDDNDE